MKIHQVLQNTDEWHQLRLTKIGASEANIIMGTSDYCTPFQLYQKKINPVVETEKENTFIQDKGHRLEKRTRSIMEIKYMTDFDAIVALSDDYDFLMASLDGYSKDEGILECKYVGQDDFDLVASGKILPQYKPQIMQQLLVTAAPKCILSVCTEDNSTKLKDEETGKEKAQELKYCSIEILPDNDYIFNQLLPAIVAFRKCVETKTPPKLVFADKLDQSSDKKLSDMMTRYVAMKKELDDVEDRMEKLKNEIFKQTKHSNVICDEHLIQNIPGKPGEKIDYESFIKDAGLKIEDKYIKKTDGKSSKKITIKKEKNEVKPEKT